MSQSAYNHRTPLGKLDYSAMSNQQLASLMRQFRRSRLELECEWGHPSYGCSNVAAMNGKAACSQMVELEIKARSKS